MAAGERVGREDRLDDAEAAGAGGACEGVQRAGARAPSVAGAAGTPLSLCGGPAVAI